MNATIVLTVIGKDQPGIVEAVSDVLATHGGNWIESSMSSLAGQFAGILLASLPSDRAETCLADLEGLDALGLSVIARITEEGGAAAGTTDFSLDLVGHDHPGIVRDITRVLKRLNVNVLELETEVESASMAGGDLFHARARLRAPDAVGLADIQDELEGIATELMVEIRVERS
jgi:glycine cleavage system regulatory protein